MEMWMACVFQTLQARDLENFLPESSRKYWSGYHLNIALPLWQNFSDDLNTDETLITQESFTSLLRSPDENIRKWAEDARNAFLDLRNSPDVLLRKYYVTQMKQNITLAHGASQGKKIQNLQGFLKGKFRTVHGNDHNGFYVSCGPYPISISVSLCLSIQSGDSVHIKFFLMSEPNRQRYAINALPTDPASRLLIQLGVRNRKGEIFQAWLRSQGKVAVFSINALVDSLEGFTREESMEFARRSFRREVLPSIGSSKRKRDIYRT
jgi:hypothetical protein